MRAAILLALLALPATASANNSSRIGISASVLPSVRYSELLGAPVRKIATGGGAVYVLPLKGSASVRGGAAPSIAVVGGEMSFRQSSAATAGDTLEGDLSVFVPEGSQGRVVVTVLADGAPPGIRRRR